MRLGRHRFSLPLVPGLTVLALLPLLASLGVWQLQRAAYKVDIQERFDSASSQSASTAASAAQLEQFADFAVVEVQGEWLDQQLLQDNRVWQQRVGVEVLTPLRLDTKELVLVNRGWTPITAARGLATEITPSPEPLTITARVTRPSVGLVLSDAIVDATQDWPKWIQAPDFTQLESLYTERLANVVLQPLRETESSWLLVDNWQPAGNGPHTHYGYAFQWFALSIALALLTLFAALRRGARMQAREDS